MDIKISWLEFEICTLEKQNTNEIYKTKDIIIRWLESEICTSQKQNANKIYKTKG